MKLNNKKVIKLEGDASERKFYRSKNSIIIFSKKNKNLSSIIIDKLNERERLGSTSVGNGIAIPHTKVNGIKETQVIFLKLI